VKLKKRQRALILIGSLGPLGYLPASGTITVAVIGLPLFYLMRDWHPVSRAVAAIIVTLLAVWVHHVGDRILGEKDSRKLVWDEVAGFMIATAFLPWTWRIALIAFFIERVIDILKIPPASWIERAWPGGWGVVGDDVVAGIYSYAIVWLMILLAPVQLGLPH
jgi:phosphatidylglycerophosphatase A